MRFFDTRLGRCATLLALGGGVALYAQGTQTASATITVVDKSGGAVAGARVRLTSPNLMAERTGATNASGVFIARLLPPGTYTIEVIKDGFQTTRDVRAIGMDQHYQPRIVLQPVGNTTVEIQATVSSAIDPTDIKTAANYDAKRIDELPMGRTPDSIALITPGVTTGVGGRTQVRGAMTSGNMYLLDGQRVADNTFNTNMTHLVTDSFEETQVITGAISAEYGEVDGAVINTITKSGGNEFTAQVRWDLSNQKWNAVRAHTTDEQRAGISDRTSQVRQFTLGGFFIKDRLWFHLSAQTQSTATTSWISSASPYKGPDGAGAPYTSSQDRLYLVGKLTWRINDDHSIIGSYSDNQVDIDNRNYGAGHLRALGMQREESGVYNLAWRAVWSPTLNTEARYGGKRQMIAAGPKDGTYNPNGSYLPDGTYSPDEIMDSCIREWSRTGLWFNNGPFTGSSAPDDRDNTTANIKASYFGNWMGTHELDLGFDYYQGVRKGTNQQSVTRYTFFVNRLDVSDPDRNLWTASPNFLVYWFGQTETSTTTTMGLYVNDKWKLNSHWAFQIGFRFDNYSAEATDTTQTSGASGFSPRLGTTFDLFGDQTVIFKASYCIYHASVLEVVTGVVSGAGNIGQDQRYWTGPVDPGGNNQLLRDVMDVNNYTRGGDYADPLLNIFINSNMKPPTCAEIQLGAAYSLFTDRFGQGFLSATFVNKNWSDMIDYSIGNNTPNKRTNKKGEDIFTEFWDNEPLAERKYTSVEVVADWTWRNLHVSGNATFSSLTGNYEGETSGNPGSGQALNYFRYLKYDVYNDQGDLVKKDHVEMLYDTKKLDPVGYLSGHKPIVMTWMVDYNIANRWGRTALGYMYSFESGSPYSDFRNVPTSAYHPLLGDPDYTTYGEPSYQYRNDERTHGRFWNVSGHDLSITHDFNMYRVMGKPIRAFVKVILYNVFNRQQQVSWNEPEYAEVTEAQIALWGSLDAVPWTEDTSLATEDRRGGFTNANFNYARQIRISAGVRF
jgi:outer membrane receptor for ferrienterochelin and colicin